MASQPLRRSPRGVATNAGANQMAAEGRTVIIDQCDRCGGNIAFHNHWANEFQGRCANCSHFNDYEHLTFTAGADVLAFNLCVCMCTCVEPDPQDDADFEMSSDEESEDGGEPFLDANTERNLARRTGWQTNVILNEGTDDERRIMFEGPGHAAVAAGHDPLVRAESSLRNQANRVGITEYLELREPLAHWEVTPIQQAHPSQTWDDLQQIFPEMGEMGHHSPIPSPVQEPIICRWCRKPMSDGWREWAASGNMQTCPVCSLSKRPVNPEDDPDWHQYNPSMPGTMEHCHCRCQCNLTSSSTNSSGDVDMIPAPQTPDRRPTESFASGLSTGSTEPRLRLPHIPFLGAWTGAREQGRHMNLSAEIAQRFELPVVRLSHDNVETTRWALEDCMTAIAAGDYPSAIKYNQIGLAIGRYWGRLGGGHPLMNNLLLVGEHLNQFFDETIDNSYYEDPISPPSSADYSENGSLPDYPDNGSLPDYSDVGSEYQQNRNAEDVVMADR